MIGTKINLSKAPTDISVASLFIAEYAAWLYGCGATCTRIQKNVERMASEWSLQLEMNIMPENIQLTVFDSESRQSQVYSKKTPHTGISFYKNTQLSKLSWAVADKKIGLEDAQRAFQKIISAPFTVPWVVLVLTSLANMSFCRIFGGDFMAMLIVFMATLLGYRLKQILLEAHIDTKFVFLICAFFSAVIGASGYVFGLGNKPDVALGTCVLYLIPGIPYINSISDLMVGQYLVSFSRFMNSMVLTFCLSVGLAGAILLLDLRLF